MENCPKESGDNRNPQSNSRGSPRHHHQFEIEVKVEGARASIKEEEVQCQRR